MRVWRYRHLLALSCGFGIAGALIHCANAANVTNRQLTQQEMKTVEDAVRRSLTDPASAQFGELSAAADDANLVAVCGYVNAKNGFGGYVGAKPFRGVLIDGQFEVTNFGNNDKAVRETVERCRSFGIDVRALSPVRAEAEGGYAPAALTEWRSMFQAHPLLLTALIVFAAIGVTHLLSLVLRTFTRGNG